MLLAEVIGLVAGMPAVAVEDDQDTSGYVRGFEQGRCSGCQ